MKSEENNRLLKILVTGSNGQVGQELRVLAEGHNDIEFHFTGRQELDITDKDAVSEFVKNLKPDFIINCAAYTAVDKAEEDVENATLVNADAVEYLANASKENDVWLLHISSDYVYHIEPERPLLESDDVNPKGVYAKTKLEGEKRVENSSCKYCIMRTSWVYSSFGNNFVKTMLRLGKDRDNLNIVSDQIGAPTYARDIAKALIAMVEKVYKSGFENEYIGRYNFANEGQTNWSEFAIKIFELAGLDCQVGTTTTQEYGAPAPRPLWSVMDLDKFKKTFKMQINDWQSALQNCLIELNQNQAS